MRAQEQCPLCERRTETKIMDDFWYCNDCEIAVRPEHNMPAPQENFYGVDWVRDQDSKDGYQKRIDFLVDRIRELEPPARSVLDVGCGGGALVDKLSKYGYRAKGIDSSEAAIAYAKSCKQGEFESNSLQSYHCGGKFDLVVATQVIEHIKEPKSYIQKACSFLDQDGFLLLETPNLKSWNESSLWRSRANNVGGMDGPDHRVLYTAKGLSQLLEANHLEVCSLHTRTYHHTMISGFRRSLLSAFDNRTQAPKEPERIRTEKRPNLSANPNRTQSSVKSVLQKTLGEIYRTAIKSSLAEMLFYLPCRISERHYCGQHLVAVARKRGSVR